MRYLFFEILASVVGLNHKIICERKTYDYATARANIENLDRATAALEMMSLPHDELVEIHVKLSRKSGAELEEIAYDLTEMAINMLGDNVDEEYADLCKGWEGK